MEKLCKMAKRIDIALKALQILIVVLTVLLASVFLLGRLTGNHGSWSLSYRASYIAVSAPLGWLVFLATEGIALYGLHIFRRILQPMKQGLPFASSVSGDMRRLGWFVLITGGALSVLGMFDRQIITTPSDVIALERQPVDLTFLVISAIVFLFSYIFRYGEELQRLSDETL